MFRTHECDSECVHAKICGFKDEYIKMFNSLFDKTYPLGEGGFKKIGDSSIVVSLECPHYLKRGTDNG